VVIRGNQVLVPTRLSHGGGEIEVMLLLDTGASLTTVSRGVADRLGLAEEQKMSARVAGGGVIRFHTGRIETLRIGNPADEERPGRDHRRERALPGITTGCSE
jgi:predicted aspartyl protease